MASAVKEEPDVVFFFGKKRKLNAQGELKVGRLTVSVVPELVGRPKRLWYATLSGYKGEVTIEGPLARSPASATKKLERRIDSLYSTFRNLYENYGV